MKCQRFRLRFETIISGLNARCECGTKLSYKTFSPEAISRTDRTASPEYVSGPEMIRRGTCKGSYRLFALFQGHHYRWRSIMGLHTARRHGFHIAANSFPMTYLKSVFPQLRDKNWIPNSYHASTKKDAMTHDSRKSRLGSNRLSTCEVPYLRH